MFGLAARPAIKLNSWDKAPDSPPLHPRLRRVRRAADASRAGADAETLEAVRADWQARLTRVQARAEAMLAGRGPHARGPPIVAGPTFALKVYRAADRPEPTHRARRLRSRVRQGKEDPAPAGRTSGPCLGAAPRRRAGLAARRQRRREPVAAAPDRRAAGRAARPGVLVTSGTRTSAELLAQRLPERRLHQYVPIDAPGRGPAVHSTTGARTSASSSRASFGRTCCWPPRRGGVRHGAAVGQAVGRQLRAGRRLPRRRGRCWAAST